MSASREKKQRKVEVPENLPSINKKKVQDKEQQRRNRIYTTSAIVLAVVLVIAVGLAVFQGIIAPNMPVATIGGVTAPAHEVNYYYDVAYRSVVNSSSAEDLQSIGLNTSLSMRSQPYYYDSSKTWHDYFLDSALRNLQQMRMLVANAEADGFVLSEESETAVAENIAEFRTDVEENTDFTFAKYLELAYGAKMTITEYERLVRSNFVAQEYVAQVADGFEYSEQELLDHYNENANAFDLFSFRRYFVSAGITDDMTEEQKTAARDTAHAKAQVIFDRSTDEQAFLEQVAADYVPAEPAEGEEAAEYTTINADVDTIVSEYDSALMGYYFHADVNTWVQDAARAANEFTLIDTDSGSYVIMFKERIREEYNTIDVRHILVNYEVDTDEEGNALDPTDEQKETARVRAEELLAEWEGGDATEDSFAALANEHSDDPGSNTNGGLYESAYDGQFVTNFNLWCFAEGRLPGDTGVVSTDYGYHIMYFVGESIPRWQQLAMDGRVDLLTGQPQNGKRDADYSAWQSEQLEAYEIVNKGGRGVGLYGDR